MNHQLDTVHLRRRFRKTFASYASHAVVQKEITRRALERLDYIKYEPQRILDLSLHYEVSGSALRQRFPKAAYIATAIDPVGFSGLKKSLFKKPRAVCLSYESLPFQENSVDLIFMSLSLLWGNNAPQLLRDCYRVLQPGGMLLFTTLGPDTLKELRVAFDGVDSYEHTHNFIDMHNIGDALIELGFENPVMDLEHIEMQYNSFSQLLGDLRKTGANNLLPSRRRGLMTPRQFSHIERSYKKNNHSELCATFEFVYGHAWVGQHKRQSVNKSTGEVSIPLSNITM
jgi:malonyl-CoA O-methyltransferase